VAGIVGAALQHARMTRTARRTTAALPPVRFTPEEAAAVAVALSAQPDGPYSDAGRGALEKVLGVLEPDPARRAQLLATSLWVSAEAGRGAELRETLEHAVAQRRVVALRYRDGNGRASRREVEPQVLARTGGSWYLVAWCRERQAPRWFRADRIESAELTGETVPRRNPALFGAPSASHPAGQGRRPGPADPRRGLVVLPGGKA
jgi:predicted DNA-binding transcriptional regulator YafY